MDLKIFFALSCSVATAVVALGVGLDLESVFGFVGAFGIAGGLVVVSGFFLATDGAAEIWWMNEPRAKQRSRSMTAGSWRRRRGKVIKWGQGRGRIFLAF